MNILIIGSGGREHALAVTYAKSKRVKNVYVAPGNDFMEESSSKIHVFPTISLLDFDSLYNIAKKYRVDLVDVAQDNALSVGFVDKFSKQGFPAFGPTKNEAEIEWNKNFSRDFMKKYSLPIPSYNAFTNKKDAISFINTHPEKLRFIKASGLAFGKGVIRAETKEEARGAIDQMKNFGTSGKTFLIEEGLVGEEFSLFAICDGKRYVIAGCAQDHKTIFNKDTGTNTGGMGCISPLSIITQSKISEIKKTILNPFISGMAKENRPYSGIIYLGGILTKKGFMVIEFNARWGEPEANVILPGLQSDYVDIIEAVMMQTLMITPIIFDKKVRVSVAGCAFGYPDDYKKVLGKKIYGLEKAQKLPGISIFGSGIKREGKHYVVNGGRVFHLVSEGKTIHEARQKAYAAMSQIFIEGNNLHYRTDIGWREMERKLT